MKDYPINQYCAWGKNGDTIQRMYGIYLFNKQLLVVYNGDKDKRQLKILSKAMGNGCPSHFTEVVNDPSSYYKNYINLDIKSWIKSEGKDLLIALVKAIEQLPSDQKNNIIINLTNVFPCTKANDWKLPDLSGTTYTDADIKALQNWFNNIRLKLMPPQSCNNDNTIFCCSGTYLPSGSSIIGISLVIISIILICVLLFMLFNKK